MLLVLFLLKKIQGWFLPLKIALTFSMCLHASTSFLFFFVRAVTRQSTDRVAQTAVRLGDHSPLVFVDTRQSGVWDFLGFCFPFFRCLKKVIQNPSWKEISWKIKFYYHDYLDKHSAFVNFGRIFRNVFKHRYIFQSTITKNI